VRILIDDERSLLPNGNQPDLIARNYTAAVSLLIILRTDDEVYLDHDLGGGRTGYDWITMLERELLRFGVVEQPAKIVCVSDNPPGRYRIQQVIDNLYNANKRAR
jgi:hypothetical protein